MHLIEQYALSCGVKIDKPSIETLFFPVECEKYITLHASSGMESKNYDYFSDVIEIINPYLQKNNISIIQIGAKEDAKLRNCIHYNGSTSIRQSAYLIENAMLHLGNDSFSAHVASGFNKKIVCLYSILYKECCGPYWGNEKDHVLLESDRDGQKPSFSNKESPKTVNFIDPEEIACGVLDLLNIKHDANKIETIHIGSQYQKENISVVPNHIMPKSFAKGQPVNIWGHECFDEQNIAKWAYSRKCNIFLDKPMELKYLQVIKDNIHYINYYVSEDDEIKYFESLQKLGIKFNLLSKDKQNINNIRLKFFDWNVRLIETKTKKDLDNPEKICDNSRYKCSTKIVSGGQVFNSKAAWKFNQPGDHDQVIDCEEFWEDLDMLRIYNQE